MKNISTVHKVKLWGQLRPPMTNKECVLINGILLAMKEDGILSFSATLDELEKVLIHIG